MMRYMLGRFSPGLSGSLSFLLLTLASVGSSSAQQVPNQPQPSPRERTERAQAYTAERLALWQQRLNLQEWNISVVMARASELKPKTLGNIHWDLPKKTATIHVLDPADYHLADKEMLQDMEFTVVHELIHLELAPVLSDLQRSDANRREEEHSVNHMADALLKLDRGK
jgi:hypothetical protein